jgi:hypothetical protein
MAERDAKRLRLAGLIGLKGISTSALAAVMNKLDEEPMEPLSARQIDKFISETYTAVGHTIELPLVKGRTWEWKVCRLDRLMAFFAKRFGSLSADFDCSLASIAGRTSERHHLFRRGDPWQHSSP